MAFYNASEIDYSNRNILLLIYGNPSVGKSTISLGLNDFDYADLEGGLSRVEYRYRPKRPCIVQSYEELLDDISHMKSKYLIVDTIAALQSLIAKHVIKTQKNASQSDGNLSQKGYGYLRTEFDKFCDTVLAKQNLILVGHAKTTQKDDGVFYELSAVGSGKEAIWQRAELAAFMQIINQKRYLCFSSSEQYYAKGNNGIKGLIEVPTLDDNAPNNFMEKLISTYRKNVYNKEAAAQEEQKSYESIMEQGKVLIDTLSQIDQIRQVTDGIKSLPSVLSSAKELTALLKQKIADNGWKWNAEKKNYEVREGA